MAEKNTTKKSYLGYDGLRLVIDLVKDKFAFKGHKHTKSDITDLTIPTKVSELENDLAFTSVQVQMITWEADD